MAAAPFYAIIAGVGPGTGRATALKFARSYPVVLLARSAASYEDAVKDVKAAGGNAIGISADVQDAKSLAAVVETIKKELPGSKLAAAVYNVSGGFARKPFLELTAEELDAGVGIQAHGFFHFAQATLPLLLESVATSTNPPSLIVTGATASVRGSANFASFAAGKFALRGLTQSLSREFGPKGVHVAHALIDGVIDIPRTKGWAANDGAEDGKLSPEAIADAYWYLHTQHRSAFTQELDLRPYVEKF